MCIVNRVYYTTSLDSLLQWGYNGMFYIYATNSPTNS